MIANRINFIISFNLKYIMNYKVSIELKWLSNESDNVDMDLKIFGDQGCWE